MGLLGLALRLGLRFVGFRSGQVLDTAARVLGFIITLWFVVRAGVV